MIGCLCSCAFVKQSEYRGVRGHDRAVSVSGKGVLEPLGAWGGAMGGLIGLALWDSCGVDPNAGRPGLGSLVGGWARLTESSPNESDSLSDSGSWQFLTGAGIDFVDFNSFAGN